MSQPSANKKDDFGLNISGAHESSKKSNKTSKSSSRKLASNQASNDKSANCDFKNDALLENILDYKKAQLLNSPQVLEFLKKKR